MKLIPSLSTLAFAAALSLAAPASQAIVITYHAFLDGPSESPPNASPGTGEAFVTYDSVAHTLDIHATWAGLVGLTTVAHIHAPTAAPFTGAVGVAVTPGTLPGFPVGVTSGIYDVLLDLTLPANYTGGFLALGGGTAAGAEALLIASFDAHTAYFNIHSNVFPGGEIRGFLVVPEPTTAALLGLGLLGLALRRKGA
jgi:CHRD domain-containing protein/PEP-CTERM motif-containing protein